MLKLTLSALALALAFLPAASATGPDLLRSGSIEGAPYLLALPTSAPEQFPARLLLVAHGLRPPDAPLLPGLDPDASPYRELRAQGWAIAATSYRRNGLILRQAATDLRSLLAAVPALWGRSPEQTFLLGESMGGAIATSLAEDPPPALTAILACGAALDLQEKGVNPWLLLATPKIPLLFLSNRSETASPAAYIARVPAPQPPAVITPVLWTADRDGHVNLHPREILQALQTLQQWTATNTPPAPRNLLETEPPRPSSLAFAPGNTSATLPVHHIDPFFGNITLDIQPADLADLRLATGQTFLLSVRDNIFPVLLGHDYSDVKFGQWIAFPTAENRLLVARNLQNAATTADLHPDDTLTITPQPR